MSAFSTSSMADSGSFILVRAVSRSHGALQTKFAASSALPLPV